MGTSCLLGTRDPPSPRASPPRLAAALTPCLEPHGPWAPSFIDDTPSSGPTLPPSWGAVPPPLQGTRPLHPRLTSASMPLHVLFPVPGMLIPFFVQPCLLFLLGCAKPPVQGVISTAGSPWMPSHRATCHMAHAVYGLLHAGQDPSWCSTACTARHVGGREKPGPRLADRSRQVGGCVQPREAGEGCAPCSQPGGCPVFA